MGMGPPVDEDDEIDFGGGGVPPVPDPPTFVAVGTTGAGVGAGISPGLPAGLAVGDVMLMAIETNPETASVVSPAGWLEVADSPQFSGALTQLNVFWKRAAGGESAPVLWDPVNHLTSVIAAFRGCVATGDPWDVTAADVGASSTVVTIPGDTTTVANCLIVALVAHSLDAVAGIPQFSNWANADLTGVEERYDASTDAGGGGGLGIATGVKATAGAYGPTTATLANASVQPRISIALRPA